MDTDSLKVLNMYILRSLHIYLVIRRLSTNYPSIFNISRTGHVAWM